MKNQIITILCVILICFSMMACDNHKPCGILEEKEHINAHVTWVYSTVTHHPRPICHPQCWIFHVRCDSCGKRHSTIVEKATFDRFNVGDHIDAKGFYYGKKDQEER